MLGEEFEYNGKKLIAVYSSRGECKRCIFEAFNDNGDCTDGINIEDEFNIDCSKGDPDLVFIEDTRK